MKNIVRWSGRGLNPKPPDPREEALEWSEAELYWIVKKGIKMSGMPGFGPTHDDSEIWQIVACVAEFPKISSHEYRDLTDFKKSGHSH